MQDISVILEAVKARHLDDRMMARLFHGRGKTYPGFEQVAVDWYPPALFVSFFRPVDEDLLQSLVDGLWTHRADAVKTLVVQHRQGANTRSEVVKGEELPRPHVVCEPDSFDLIRDTHDLSAVNGSAIQDTHKLYDSIQDTHTLAKTQRLQKDAIDSRSMSFYVQLCNAQNVGVFPDMINGRAWVRANCQNRNVLNLFSYTCLFSIAAKQGGAERVVNVDMNKSVMAQGQKNHKLNEIDKREVHFFTHNIFNSWAKIKRYGQYDLIIIDPPSFQKGSFALTKDYQKLIKRLPELAVNGADVLLCLNSPEFGCDYMHELVTEHCPELQFQARLPNHPDFPEIDEQKSLKVLLYRFTA